MNNITVSNLIKHTKYKLINKGSNVQNKVQNLHIMNLGLELLGVTDRNDKDKIIVVGKKEIKYIINNKLEKQLLKLIKPTTPCIIVCDNAIKKYMELLGTFLKINTPILSTDKSLDIVILDIYSYLTPLFAPSELIHGTLLSVFGLGILLTGESGIGKSEIALELVKRGHRLVADDSVVTYILNHSLYGRPVEHQKNILEVRGLGLVDVYRLFGVNAILDAMPIDLVINLVKPEDLKTADRLTDPLMKETINGVKCPLVRLPLNQARNIVDIIEVAVMDFRNRKLGYSATKEFIKRYDKLAKGE